MSPRHSVSTMFTSGLLGLLLAAPLDAAQPPPWRPPEGMSSRCEELLTPERLQIAEDWKQVEQEIAVLSRPEGESRVELRKKYRFELFPSEQVTFALPEDADKTGRYAGLLTLRTAGAGAYRVSTTPYVWLELVKVGEEGKGAGVTTSDKRLGCAGIIKNIAFDLEADTLYWLQVSGINITPDIELMVTGPEPSRR